MKYKNHLAVIQLSRLGFPILNIRKALHKLTGVSQPQIAKQLNTTRQNITAHMDGRRNGQRIKQGIADALGVPVDAIFPEIQDHDQ